MTSPRRYFYLFVCLVGISTHAAAQGVCSSSALTPVYSQTFGTSTTSSKKNTVPSGFITNYGFKNTSSLQDGYYYVTPLVQNSGNGDWAVGGDHTGNTNGNMFLVNAGTGASTFFYQQVDNLCPGSVYSFSAWLANVNTISNTKSICGSGLVWPKVTFNIKNTSGTILATYTTDTLPLTKNRVVAPNWQQYGFQFALPSGTTSLILEMKDYYGGQPQCGNDLALDDILFSACTPTATATLNTASTICSGTSTSITCGLVNSPFSSPAYQWQKSTDGGTTWSNIGTPGTGAATFTISSAVVGDAGTYRAVVGPDVASLSSNTCITASSSVSLSVNPSPSVTATSNSPLCSGNTLTLTSVPSGGTTPYTYSWSGPNSFTSTIQSPSIANVTTAAGGSYAYIVTDNKGCTATATVNVSVGQTPTNSPITGSTSGCVGSVLTLSDATPGGVWNSSNPAVASVNQAGQVTLLTGGTALISYTMTNGSCSNAVTTTVNSIGVTLHPDVIECNNGISHFDATDIYYGVTYSNSNVGNTYNWTITGGPFSYQGSSTSSTQYPGVQLQTGYSYKAVIQFTSSGFTCSDTQMVYKNVVAADTIQGSRDTTVCFNTGPVSITATASPVTNQLSWTSSGTGTFSAPTSLSTTYTPSAADKALGVIKLYLSGSSTLNATGNCGTSTAKDSMILRIYPDNTASNTTQTICSNQVLAFTPVSAIPGSSFSWASAISSGSVSGNSATGTGNITDSLVNPSSTVDAVVVYTITPYAFTPSNKTCSGTPYTLTVTVKPKPAITITNNAASICTGTSSNLQFSSSLSGSTYTWTSSVVSGSASGNSSNATPSATNTITDLLTNPAAVNATVRYRITGKSGSGCSKTDSTDVLVYALPSAANAGTDIAVCNATSSVLAATVPTTGSGTWSFVSGPSAVTFTNANSVTSGVNGLVSGTYLFEWAVTNGSCLASRDTVRLVNSSNTVAGAVNTSTAVCAGTNSGSLTLSGYTGAILRWESSTDGGSTWPTSISNTTASYSFSNLNSTTLFRAVVQNGSCGVNNATPATITVNAPTVAGVVTSDMTVCYSSNSGDLTLAGNTGNVVRWESSVNGGTSWTTIVNTTNINSFSNITATTQYRAVVKNGTCGAINSNAVTVTVSPATVAGTITANATVCAGGNNGTLNLAGQTGNVVRWESSTDNGTTWTNIANSTTSLTYNNLAATTLYRALVQSGVCGGVYTNNVTITVLQAVTAANAGPDQALCNVTAATLAANTPTSGTGSWSAVAGNPTSAVFANAANPGTAVSGLVAGTYSFIWTVTNGTCVDSKDTVQVLIYPAVIPGAVTANATVCAGSNSGTLTLSGNNGTVVRWESSTDNGVTWTTIANTTSSLTYTNLTATTRFHAVVQVGNCAVQNASDAVITVLQAVSAANAGVDQQLCSVASATMAATVPTSGTGTWSAVAGNPTVASFTNAASATTTVNGLATGTYQFIWTVSNGTCADSKDTVQVIIYPVTTPGTLTADATVCATSNGATLLLTGYATNILRWESSTDNGASWSNVANTTSSLVYNNLSASTKYRALVQNAVCPALYSNVVNITVLQPVTTANAGADQQLCNVTAATMAGNTPASGTGTWTALPGNPSAVTFVNAANPSTTVNGLTTGTYQFVWTISNGLCTDSKDTVQFIVYPATVAGTASSNATVCATSNSGNITLAGQTGNILRWESSGDNGATWANIANTTTSISYTNLTVTTLYRALVQSGNCTSLYSNNVTITVLQPVTTANAGADQQLCNVTAATMAGNTPTSGTGKWTALPGNPSVVTFVNAANPSTTVNGLVPGTYQFEWTISNGTCADSKDDVQVIVYPATIAGTASSNATVCATSNSGNITLAGQTGNILRWESSTDNGTTWSNIANTTTSISYTNLTATTIYRALVQSGNCTSLYSNNVTITVLQAVSTANAGVDQQLCSVTSATMAATVPTSGTGSWAAVPGNPSVVTFTNPASASTTVNGLTTGTYQFEWTVSNGTCADSKDIVQVVVYPSTTPGTPAADATVCATSNTGTINLSGYVTNILRWESSTDNGTTWNNIANTTSALTYNNLAASTKYRALVQNAICPSLYSNLVNITVLQPVTTANAGADQQLCNVTAATLAGNTPTSGTGTWTAVPGNPSAVTFVNAANPSTTVNGLVPGTYQFEWTISNGLCVDSKDIVQIIVYPATVAGTASSNATVCATSNSGTITLAGQTGNILRWESSTDNGTTWNNIANTTTSISYTNLTGTTLYRALVQSGNCTSLYSNTVTITVLQPVTTANAGADQQLCNVTSTTMAGNSPTSGTGKWTALPGNPSVVTFVNAANPSTTVNGLVPGTYQFEWTISNGTCADSKDDVQVIVYPATVAGTASSNATVCATSNSGNITLAGQTGNILRWESSTDNGTTWSNIANTTTSISYTNLTATTIYRALVQSGNCTSLYSNNVTITVQQAVSTANAGVDQQLCSVTSATMAATVPTSGTGSWAAVPGNPSVVTFTNPTSATTTVNGLTTGTYQFEWTVSNGTCADSKDIVQVIVYPSTTPGTLAADATVCATSNTGTLNLSGYATNVLNWESSSDNGTTWNTIANTTGSLVYNNLAASTKYRALVQNAICPALYSNVVSITVLQPVTVALAGPDTTVINGITSYKLVANTPTSGTGTWTVIPGGPSTLTFSNVNDPKATVGGLDYIAGPPPADGIYKLIWTISNGVCSSSTDTMQITMQPPTNPGRIGPDAVVCVSNNHGTLVLTDYFGTILQWETSIDYGATWSVIPSTVGQNLTSYTYDNLTTTTLFRALVQNGVGLQLYSGIAATVTVLQLVTPSNAGPDQVVCNSTSATLAGNTPTSGTGTWVALPGNPSSVTFSNASDPASVVNGLTYGTYQFDWVISNGFCSDSHDIVTITVQQPTIAGTLAVANTVCATSNSGTLNISGYRGSILGDEISTDGGNTWSAIANTATLTSYTYTNLPVTSQFRTQVQNGVCPALFTNIVTITVLSATTVADAGPDQQLCNVTGATLAGNTPTSGAGTWTAVAGNPTTTTFTNPNDPATTVNGLTTGTYQFEWTISNGLCADTKDRVSITVYAPTVPGSLATDATVCATSNGGTLTLSGYSSNILNWETSTDNGTTWSNLALTANNYTYTNLGATTSYRANVQNAVCPAMYSNMVTITVLQPVTTADAGPDQALCNASGTTLAGNTPTSGTGTWTALPGNPSTVSFTNASDPNTTVNGLTSGTYHFAWTISNALCADSKDFVDIVVYDPTLPGTLATAVTVCATANSGTLTLTGYRSSILRWETSTDNGATWNNVALTASSSTYNNLAATTTYRTLAQNAVCPALYSNEVTVTVLQPVTTANAGPDQQLCNTTTATLAGNTPTSGTGTWTALPGNPTTVSFVNAADPATVVNGLTTGTYQFEWTISNALCQDSKDIVSITVSAPTVAGTLTSDATVCATLNSGTLLLTGNVGSILRWETSTDNGTSWNNITLTAASYAYTNTATTTAYRAYVQNAVCPALYSNLVTVTVLQPVTIANAGADQSLCNVTGTTLAANTPTSGTGLWTAVAGNPTAVTFTNPADPATTVNGLVAGTYKFTWTISNALCEDSKDEMTVTVYGPTVPGVLAADATVCATSNGATINLSGHQGSILRWETSADNGTTWNNMALTATAYSYTNLAATTSYRTYVQNAICPALYSNAVTVTVLQPVTIADAGVDQARCNVSGVTLAANTPTSGTGTWTAAAGNPSATTFTNAGDPATTVNGLVPGTYQFNWTISNGMCADSKDSVIVTVYATTLPGVLANDATVCATANSGLLRLSGYRSKILNWETSTNNGVSWNNLALTADSLDYTNLSATTMYRAQVQNGVCASMYSNNVTVTVLQPVTPANAGADQALCNTTTTTLTGNTPSSGTGRWTAVAGNPGTATFVNAMDPGTIVNGLTAGTYQFVWTISNGICDDSKDTVSVTVYAPTLPGTLASDATVCATANNGLLKLSGYRSSVLRWETSADNGVSWNNVSSTADTLAYTNLTATTAYRALAQNVVCPALYSNIVTITVVQAVTPANAGADQQLCNSTGTTLASNTPASGTGIWTAATTNPTAVTFTNAADPNTTVKGLAVGTYSFAWNITNGVCSGSSDTVTVTVYSPTVPGTLFADAAVCATANNGMLHLTGYNNAVLRWENSVDNGTNWNNIALTTDSLGFTNLTTTTTYRTYVQHAVCPAMYSNAVTITVVPPVSTADAGVDQQLCNTTTARLAAAAPTSGNGTWTAAAGNPSAVSFVNASDPATVVNGLTTGTYKFNWTVANGTCADSQDSVVLTVFAATNAGTLVADSFVCATSNMGTLRLGSYVGKVMSWQSSTDSGATWTTISATTDTLAYTGLNATTQFRAMVQNGPCNTVLSNIVTVNVSPATVPGKITSSNSTVCTAVNSGTLSLSGNTGTIIRWEVSEDDGSTWNSIVNSGSSYAYTNLTKQSLFRVAVQSGACNVGFSDTVRVAVDSATVAGTLAGDATVCATGNSGALTLTGKTGKIVHWESSRDKGLNWKMIADTSSVLNYSQLDSSSMYRALVQNGVCAMQYSNAVAVAVIQPVTTAVAGTDQLLCNADSATVLTGNVPVSGTGKWTMVKGPAAVSFADANAATTKVSGLIPGTYQFAWTISNGICEASASTMTVKVDQVKSSFTLSGKNECGQTIYHFIDSSSSFAGISGYKWSVSAGDTATGKVHDEVFLKEGRYHMSHQAISNSGCILNTGADFDVHVFEFPKANINAINEACKKQLLQLTPTVNSRDSIAYLLWNLGNGQRTKDSLIEIQYYEEGAYSVKLTVSTVNQCFDSVYKQIVVHPLPVVTVKPAQNLCKGDSLTLVASGADIFLWRDESGGLICNNCATPTVKPTEDAQYQVMGVNQYGCSQIASTKIRVIQPFKMNASPGDSICVGNSRPLFASGAVSYQWFPSTGLTSTSSPTTIAKPATTTTYRVIGRDGFQCFNDTAEIRLVVGEPTQINIGRDTVVTAGVTIKLRAIPALQNIRKWTWGGLSGFSCSNCAEPEVKVSQDAAITALAVNNYGCVSNDTLLVKTFCGSTEVFIPNAFTPDGDGVNDMLFVQGKGIKMVKTFRIFNRWGELIFEKNNFSPGDERSGWDGKIRGVPAPPDVFVYMCEVICEKGIPFMFKGNVAIIK